MRARLNSSVANHFRNDNCDKETRRIGLACMETDFFSGFSGSDVGNGNTRNP